MHQTRQTTAIPVGLPDRLLAEERLGAEAVVSEWGSGCSGLKVSGLGDKVTLRCRGLRQPVLSSRRVTCACKLGISRPEGRGVRGEALTVTDQASAEEALRCLRVSGSDFGDACEVLSRLLQAPGGFEDQAAVPMGIAAQGGYRAGKRGGGSAVLVKG